MTNDNNNINELVADDDDPTAELEILSLAKQQLGAEADAKTFDSAESEEEVSSHGVTVSELESDLRSRKKIIVGCNTTLNNCVPNGSDSKPKSARENHRPYNSTKN